MESASRIVALNLSERSSPVPLAFEGSAAEIWREIEGERTVRDIAESIARRHGVEPIEVEADVQAFLEEMLDLGLLGSS